MDRLEGLVRPEDIYIVTLNEYLRETSDGMTQVMRIPYKWGERLNNPFPGKPSQ